MKKFACTLFVSVFLLMTLFSCAHVHEFDDWEVTKEATCTEQGRKERYCSCGEKQTKNTALTDHKFGEWETVKEATTTSEGLAERYCECGETDSKTIDKLLDDDIIIDDEGGIHLPPIDYIPPSP